MLTEVRSAGWATAAIVLLLQAASATSIPRLSFEELTDDSDVIVSGNVVRSWSAWDASHKYIWTHYEIAVDAAQKGAAGTTVEIAEPGGVVAGIGMTVAGSVTYTPGEKVVVFAERMPNGYMRTTGWSQGKYSVDNSGLLHAGSALKSAEIVDTKSGLAGAATSLRTLSGMTVSELNAHVAARIRATRSAAPQKAKVQ